jgi:UDP-N-acetylmuramoylalanine--D-glutamate ligase
VVECSSYQIDLAPTLNPSAGILLNLTPDHLDRHGTMQHYADIKERLVAGSDVAIVGVDDSYCEMIADRIERAGGKVIRISRRLPLGQNGIYAEGTKLVQASEGAATADRRSRRHPDAARQPQCAERGGRRCRLPAVGVSEDEIRAGLPRFRDSSIACSRWAAGQRRCSSTIPRRPMPMRQRLRCRATSGSTGLRAALPKEGGITTLSPFFPAYRQGLSDRRGGGRICRDAWRGGALRDFRNAGAGRRACGWDADKDEIAEALR